MAFITQVFNLTWLGLRGLPQRAGSALVIVIGIAGVVAVLVSLLAMRDGFTRTLAATGRLDEAIVLRGGANTELSSRLTREDLNAIASAPGLLQDTDGKALVSGEVVVVLNLPKIGSGTDANVQLRGVGPAAFALRSQLQVTTGRAFERGKRELLVGEGAASQFTGLTVGNTLTLGNEPWTVVGFFKAGDAHDSELWADAEVVQGAYRRDAYQSATTRLVDAAAFERFQQAIAADPRLKVDVQTTRDYYASQSQRLRTLIGILAGLIAAIMAIGAAFAALNTMYAAVAQRSREIAVLRALGFSGRIILCAVLLEALALALVGGVLGGATAWALFDNYTVSTLGQNFSQVVFAFDVSLPLVLSALRLALLIGFIGGLLPALHAARAPLTSALRGG